MGLFINFDDDVIPPQVLETSPFLPRELKMFLFHERLKRRAPDILAALQEVLTEYHGAFPAHDRVKPGSTYNKAAELLRDINALIV